MESSLEMTSIVLGVWSAIDNEKAYGVSWIPNG